MSTVGDMITRIGDELEDTAFNSGGQALKAINDAVKQYRGKRFWFNSVYAKSFTVAASTETAIPSITVTGISSTEPITVVDRLVIDDGDGANYREVTQVDNAFIEEAQTSSVTGRPEYFALVSDSSGTAIRWYPIPDQEYTAKLTGLIRFAEFDEDADTNPWTNDAEILIRQAAKRIIMSDVTKELPPGSAPLPAEQIALSDLYKETKLRTGSPPLRMEVAMLQGSCGGNINRG